MGGTSIENENKKASTDSEDLIGGFSIFGAEFHDCSEGQGFESFDNEHFYLDLLTSQLELVAIALLPSAPSGRTWPWHLLEVPGVPGPSDG
jgi:hypothetical protein